MVHLTVLGGGYVGVVTASGLAAAGHRVNLYELDAARAKSLLEGRVPFHEPGLQEQVDSAIASGRLHVVDTPSSAFDESGVTLICVGTPLGPDGVADVGQIASAAQMIAVHAPTGVVVVRSTLPLGVSKELPGWLGRSSHERVATNPEFLRQGSALADFRGPNRIVIGTADGSGNHASKTVQLIYEFLDAPVIVTDFASAEMIKNVSNAFLATKLSFVNEVADLCEKYDARIDDVVAGMGLDPRIGPDYLRPGIGFGGSCLPKELANLVRLGHERGTVMPLLEGAASSNGGRAARIVDRLAELLGPLAGCRVALLGLAFKANTDDLRYSPAIAIAQAFTDRGASVVAHDPVVAFDAAQVPASRAATAEEAFEGADLIVVATEWPEYRDLDWAGLALRTNRPVVYDGRRLLDAARLDRDGWHVLQVGRGAGAHPGSQSRRHRLSALTSRTGTPPTACI